MADAASGSTFRLNDIHFPLPNLKAEIVSTGQRIQFNGSASPLSGELEVSLTVPRTDLPGYKAKVHAKHVEFGGLAKLLTSDVETSGKLDVLVSFSGVGDTPASMDGEGSLDLNGGDIFAIPMVGPLSPLVTQLYRNPSIGHGIARSTTATFDLGGGRLTTDDFTSSTGAYSLQGDGHIDFIHSRIDLNASLEFRRAAAKLLLSPDSRLFRFSAKGTMPAPQWQRLKNDTPDVKITPGL